MDHVLILTVSFILVLAAYSFGTERMKRFVLSHPEKIQEWADKKRRMEESLLSLNRYESTLKSLEKDMML